VEIAFDPATPAAFWPPASDVHDIPQPRYLQDVQVPKQRAAVGGRLRHRQRPADADRPTVLAVPRMLLGETIDAVAGVAFFLATDDASYVSGVNLLVDGGWMAYCRRNDRASPTSPDARRAGTSRDSSCAPSSSRTTA
jgi:NAD(P)-dependent dehydrogenase (short-subunit alcohol dehydrogenase family)